MSVFDTYGQTQLKIGDVGMKCYQVGDKVSIPDGIYVGLNGVVVIKDSVLIAEFEDVISKHGNQLPAQVVCQFINGECNK